jgi:ariadne-1
VCSGPWKDHSGSYYNCNKYDPEKDKDTADGKKKDSSRAALERYLHYYTRYTNHHNSLKFELDAKTKMENKIKEMEVRATRGVGPCTRRRRAPRTCGAAPRRALRLAHRCLCPRALSRQTLGDNTWMDCLYLNEANEALYECRYALKFTYVFAFYLPKEANFRHHFEMQQTELERQTEELAEQLEKEVAEIQRMDVVHCFQMAKKRLRNLMELVEAENSQWRAEQEAGGGSSSSHAAMGSSSSNPVVV